MERRIRQARGALRKSRGVDVIVIAGLLAVLVSELTGELAERFRRGRQKPVREFRNGSFVGREQR